MNSPWALATTVLIVVAFAAALGTGLEEAIDRIFTGVLCFCAAVCAGGWFLSSTFGGPTAHPTPQEINNSRAYSLAEAKLQGLTILRVSVTPEGLVVLRIDNPTTHHPACVSYGVKNDTTWWVPGTSGLPPC
ncbi:MAG: hypothetical protein JWN01_206 [Patescibacteria group bacterium]|nr:hypothetical protein [Patescibacteria group bacterium]